MSDKNFKVKNGLDVLDTTTITLSNAASKGLIVKAAPSPTANLQEWQDSAGTVLASISSIGGFTIPSLTVSGDLTVNGTTTNINTTNLVIEDKNIILGDVATPTNTTADGGGITLKGATDKTFNWVNSTGAWTSSEPISSPYLIVTGSTIPANGIYLPSANTLGLATNSGVRLQINSSGEVGIGAATAAGNTLRIAKSITGSTFGTVIFMDGVIASDVTNRADFVLIRPNTATSSFTLNTLTGVRIDGFGVIGAGSTINNAYGFFVDSGYTFGVSNFAFRSDVASGSNRWNFYAHGTAANYFAGQTTVGSTSLTLGSGSVAQQFGIVSAAASNVVAVVRGAASQTGDLTQWQNSAGVKQGWVDYSGFNIYMYTYRSQSNPTTGSFIVMDSNQTRVTQQTPAAVAFIVKGAASQTADLLQIQDSSANVLNGFDANGNLKQAPAELIQYGAEGSVLQNVPTRVHPAETLLKQAVWWIDAAHPTASSQTISNLGWGGSALNVTNGSSTSADSNDAKYLDWDGRNYVYLPGTSANYMPIADSAALRVTGDFELVANVQLDAYVGASNITLMSKMTNSSQRCWNWILGTNGQMYLFVFPDGTWANRIQYTTTAHSLVAGTAYWLKATFKANNGSGNSEVKFFFAPAGASEPTSWTQIGSTITGAVTSVFAGTDPIGIGAIDNGQQELATGKFNKCIFRSGIDGVAVLDVDTSVIASGAATSFTALTGQTVTVNRSTSGRKTVCVTNPLWLFGTDDYMEVNNRWLEHAPATENYVYLSGSAGNYMSTPDANVLDITGDIDIRCRVALDDWTPATHSALLSKDSSVNELSYRFYVSIDGKLGLITSSNGTSWTTNVLSSVAPTVSDGQTLWVRATQDVDNGASGNSVVFYTSSDGVTWTQLGTTITTAGTTSIFNGAAPLGIGARGSDGGVQSKGKLYRAQIYSGINGTLVFDADASVITDGTASTFKERSSNAATVTINKSGTGTFASTNSYLYLPGVASNYASAPDSAALSVTGDIDIRVKVAMDDWTPSASQTLLAKSGFAGARGYNFYLLTTGGLEIDWSTNGTSLNAAVSTVATGIADGATKWVRVTLDVDNGASGNDVTFYTSDDGTTWTKLGNTVTTAGVTSIYDNAVALEVGSYATGTSPSRGKFFRAQVLNGINGTVAFDANFESSITAQLPTTFTESSTNAATVTVNYSGTGYRSAGVLASTYVYPGNPNTFKLSTTSLLDFGATDSFTALAVMRGFTSFGSGNRAVLAKINSAGNQPGYVVSVDGLFVNASIRDNATFINENAGSGFASGSLVSGFGVVNRSTNTIEAISNTTTNGATSIATVTGSTANPFANLTLGSYAGGTFTDAEIVAAAIWRRALTAAEIAILNNYFQGRVA